MIKCNIYGIIEEEQFVLNVTKILETKKAWRISMDVNEKMTKVALLIKAITPLTPEIFYREGTNHVMAVWRENMIPNEQETAELEEALKNLGDIVPTVYRDINFLSIEILG